MNNYFSLNHYCFIFIVLAAFAYTATPVVQETMRDISDSYVRSQMKKVQGEVLFLNTRHQNFSNVCYEGIISTTLKDIVQGYSKYISCRTNKPEYSQLMICSLLKSGEYICIDGQGVRCEIYFEPNGYQCKNIL